jgi:hypothetical protein
MEIRSQKEIRDWLESGKVTMASVGRMMGCDPGVPADIRDKKTHMSMKHQARLSMIMHYWETHPEEFVDQRTRPGKPLGQKRRRLWRKLRVMKEIFSKVSGKPAPHVPLNPDAIYRFEYRVRYLILKKWGKPYGLLLLDCQPVDKWYARCVMGAKRGLSKDEFEIARRW